jgi:HEPN domain-containing protein
MIDEGIKKWLLKAIEDYSIARHELSFPEKEVSTGPVCFHCQQVAEKLLKAFLISKNIDFGKTHSLEHLLELCLEQDSEFKGLNIGNLTFYAVEVRYPDEFYIPTIEETKECFEIAKNVKKFVLGKLGIREEDIR